MELKGGWMSNWMTEVDQIVPYVVLAVVLFLVSFVALRVYLWWRSNADNAEAQEIVRRVQSETTSQARKAYRKAKRTLGARWGYPMIVEIINDISDSPSGKLPTGIEFGSAVDVLYQIKTAKEKQRIEIVLHTLGGYSLAAELVAAALKAHKGPTRAHVPYIAMSGGTMIALACKEIVLGKNAALGPIDSQYFGPFSGESFKRLLDEKPRAATGDMALLMSYEVEKYHRNAKARACEILHDAHKAKDAGEHCRVVNRLMSANLPHGQRIGFAEALEAGVQVSEGCDDDVYRLVEAGVRMNRLQSTRSDPSDSADTDQSESSMVNLAQSTGVRWI